MKKKIIVPIVLFIICLFLAFISLNVYEEYILTEEISSINDMISEDNINDEKLNDALNRYKTKYEFKKIEKTYKAIIKKRIDVIDNINKFYKEEENIDYISISSIGELDNTREKLNTSIKTIETLKNKYSDMYTDRYIKKQLKKTKPNNITTNYFNKHIFSSLKIKNDEKELLDEMEKTIYMYNEINDILVFLDDNQDYWSINGDYLEFTDQEILNQYNILLVNI